MWKRQRQLGLQEGYAQQQQPQQQQRWEHQFASTSFEQLPVLQCLQPCSPILLKLGE
jgi:hypothetical protein